MITEDFCPQWASAPGETIADILSERNMSEDEFARKLGQSADHARSLLQGRSTITIAIARQLERTVGGSVEFWIARDYQYRQQTARLREADQEWLSQLPLADMVRFGWITPEPHPSEEVRACLRFFDVANVSNWHETYNGLQQMVAFRTSPSFDSQPAAVITWLRRGEIESYSVKCNPWNPEAFRTSLPEIRSLTRQQDPYQFLPALTDLCAASGVALVIVRAPRGCRASGATRFLSPQKALLQLSFRYLTDDHFWFTFFHEAGHLLLHGRDEFFLEGPETPSTQQEEQANEFAANTLVPLDLRDEMLRLKTSRAIIRFARRIGISRGVVVGQLQHLGRLGHDQLNGLKARYQWRD
jgi:HTH-type transcriptional regulator / antitoxin HigA